MNSRKPRLLKGPKLWDAREICRFYPEMANKQQHNVSDDVGKYPPKGKKLGRGRCQEVRGSHIMVATKIMR